MRRQITLRPAGADGTVPGAATTMPVTFGRVLDQLGSTLLEIAAGRPDPAEQIGGFAIYDPLDEPALPDRALMLGVGVDGCDQVARLIRDLGPRGAAGLVVRAPAPVDAAVLDAVDRTGTVLCGLNRGASWNQLTAVLRTLLASGDPEFAPRETITWAPAGDLFALANALAALLDAPVTVEDRNSRVLAFSGRQDEADPSRVETILGRQVPERYTRALEDAGVFRALYGRSGPVLVDLRSAGLPQISMPRVAIAVRAGDDILGSIWVATREPLSPDRVRALADAAKVVALQMVRLRADADTQRRAMVDLVTTMLAGGPAAADAAARLGLAGRPAVVLAMILSGGEPAGAASLARQEAERQRAADALALHLSAAYPRAVVALLAGTAYAVVAVKPDAGAEERAAAVARDFLSRTGQRVPALIGVGRAAADAAGLTASRADAERALRVLRARRCPQAVARAADVHTDSLLLDLADITGADAPATGPVATLLAYDAAHGAGLVPTLRAWLDAFGDIAAAAAAVSVHPNTFRYRLRRISEVSGLDLDDSRSRFAAMLQLRLLDLTAPVTGTDQGHAARPA